MSNLNNTIEYINGLAVRDPRTLIERSEARYRNIIDDIANRVRDEAGREVIMLAGPSASGKTTTAGRLAEAFSRRGMKTRHLSLDDFYLNREDTPLDGAGVHDFETVFALDLPLLRKALNSLLAGEETPVPVYDFLTGSRLPQSRLMRLGESDAIIVEGLHALNPIITDALPSDKLLKIYISVSSRIYNERGGIVLNKRNLRFIRRLVRDYNFRGSSVANTCGLWEGVMAGEDKYLFPYRDNADIRINSVHLSEPCLFKDTALKLLRDAELCEKWAKDISRLIRALEQFESLSRETLPADSLLHEFLG